MVSAEIEQFAAGRRLVSFQRDIKVRISPRQPGNLVFSNVGTISFEMPDNSSNLPRMQSGAGSGVYNTTRQIGSVPMKSRRRIGEPPTFWGKLSRSFELQGSVPSTQCHGELVIRNQTAQLSSTPRSVGKVLAQSRSKQAMSLTTYLTGASQSVCVRLAGHPRNRNRVTAPSGG